MRGLGQRPMGRNVTAAGPLHIGATACGTRNRSGRIKSVTPQEPAVNFVIGRAACKEISAGAVSRAFWRNAAAGQAFAPRGWSNRARPVKGAVRRVPSLMLQSPSASIESRSSWVVACVALVAMLMAFGAAWITAVALKDIAAEVGGARSIPALASALAWLGSGAGGIMMGRIADRIGTRWTVMCGALMIGLGLVDLDPRAALAAVDRPRAVHRPDRARRHQCADVHLCQPLVRPPARLGAGADFERQLSRRRHVAADVRARHRQLRLARRPCCGTRCSKSSSSCRSRLIFFRTPPEVIHPRSRRGGAGASRARARLAAQSGVRDDVRGLDPVLHPDGDAAGPSGRLLQRSRHRPLGRRGDAVGAARHRLPFSRQIWGAISDRIGGLPTVLIGSAWQCAP